MTYSGKRGLRWRNDTVLALAGLSACALALVAITTFDWILPAPLSDDWKFWWEARQFLHGHIDAFPTSAPLAIVQVAWADVLTEGHLTWLGIRVSQLPFVVLAAVAAAAHGRHLGASPGWSAIAAAALLSTPVYLCTASSFMSDTAYIGLLLTTLLFGALWLENELFALPAIVLTALLTLQRLFGLAVVPALTVALVARHRRFGPRQVVSLLALWAVATVAAVVPPVEHWSSPEASQSIAAVGSGAPANLSVALMFAPATIGMPLMAFGPALASRRPGGRMSLTLILTALLLVVELLLAELTRGSIVPGNVLNRRGLGPLTLSGAKPVLWPLPVWLAMQLLPLGAFVAFAFWRLADLRTLFRSPGSLLLGTAAGFQLLPLLLLGYPPFDRYYLPAGACCLPLAARLATDLSPPNWSRYAAVAGLVLSLAVAIVGMQDYFAWQSARAVAARTAYAAAPASSVDAGYELNGLHYELPVYDSTRVVPGLARGREFSLYGPNQPSVRLAFAPRTDPRPGVDYTSLAPGKVLIQRASPT